jgi:hypothetical protein
MKLAVRNIVKLLRHVKSEKELYQEILTFLISHDYETVRKYGHYPIATGIETTFCRYYIRK